MYQTPKPNGDHWNHVQPPQDQLTDLLAQMRAGLALIREEYTDANERADLIETLTTDRDYATDDFDPHEYIGGSFALDAYETVHRHPCGRSDVVGRTIILGTGGPHVEISDDTGSLELRVYWSGEWVAREHREDARRTFEDFCDYFYFPE